MLLNRVLAAVVLLLVALMFYQIGAIRPGIAVALERQVTGAGSRPIHPLVVAQEPLPAVDAYLDKIAARNIFTARSQAKPEPGSPRPEATGAPKDLKLVAVSLDASSPAESMAIIRNKAEAKTYFVKPGQSVGSSDYVLDRVYGDHAVVKLRSQEFELK